MNVPLAQCSLNQNFPPSLNYLLPASVVSSNETGHIVILQASRQAGLIQSGSAPRRQDGGEVRDVIPTVTTALMSSSITGTSQTVVCLH